MKKEDFNYEIPDSSIAQTPKEERDTSWLMILDCQKKTREHKKFHEIIDYLNPGDLLILNDTKVIPARLLGRKIVEGKEGARVEVLLLNQLKKDRWDCLVRPGQKILEGNTLSFGEGRLLAHILERTEYGGRIIDFEYQGNFEELLDEIGFIPLPPYIKVKEQLQAHHHLAERYQTIYASQWGAAASPTAGLHFTEELLQQIEHKGVNISRITLHTGLGTFRPVTTENIEDHKMHAEWFKVGQETVNIIDDTRKRGGRVIAVGTTVVRALESVYEKEDCLKAASGWTDLFIYPGYKFQSIDAMITNFHLPMSTLLILVAAFGGKDFILDSYLEALKKGYRFFSFGDAMFII
ncbi:MAG: tRNA preQ1(34) S-adenosylmethionine ribosyltransferase-isomerase QueA [Candidatus Margulisbacteria bacterium]|nr:tRNA preQ1(34) S-adenosylmethionine ribosyltransferase-isomerase QueA [Candidatus Margulisiibacteriota bacterium]